MGGCGMTGDSTLSQEVRVFIDDWDRDHHPSAEEREEVKQNRKLIRVVVDDIIASRETLTDNKLAVIEKVWEGAIPGLVRDLLDERFTRDVISSVRGYVSRTMEL